MSPGGAAWGEKAERRLHAEGGGGERTECSSYSMRQRVVKGGHRASTASDDRCQRKEDGCRNDSYLSDTDEEEAAG